MAKGTEGTEGGSPASSGHPPGSKSPLWPDFYYDIKCPHGCPPLTEAQAIDARPRFRLVSAVPPSADDLKSHIEADYPFSACKCRAASVTFMGTEEAALKIKQKLQARHGSKTVAHVVLPDDYGCMEATSEYHFNVWCRRKYHLNLSIFTKS